MDTLSYKTISVNKETAKKEWVVVDASDQVVVIPADSVSARPQSFVSAPMVLRRSSATP